MFAAAWRLCDGWAEGGIEKGAGAGGVFGVAGPERRFERALSMDWSIFRSKFLTFENVSGDVDMAESSVSRWAIGPLRECIQRSMSGSAKWSNLRSGCAR